MILCELKPFNFILLISLRANTEIYSLMKGQYINPEFEVTIKNIFLPNSMFINGLVINLNNVTNCSITQKGSWIEKMLIVRDLY